MMDHFTELERYLLRVIYEMETTLLSREHPILHTKAHEALVFATETYKRRELFQRDTENYAGLQGLRSP